MTDNREASATHEVRPLIAGNWKMNGVKASLSEVMAIHDALSKGTNGTPATESVDIMICPPATLIMVMAEILAQSPIRVGAQDCHIAEKGAHTGDLSAELLADAGAEAIIVGHSERREDHAETDSIVRTKADAVHRAGLMAIVCIGETAGQREAGLTMDVVSRQLEKSVPENANAENCVIAYEPVWAIGTGLTPKPDEVGQIHHEIRNVLKERFAGEGDKFRILYGGSVKPSNATELMQVSNVNGALVGGASLKADDFLGIIKTYKT